MDLEAQESKELVNHPEHYNKPGRKECIVEIEERYGRLAAAFFSLGSAYKYLYRDGAKDEHDQEIAKARWYINHVENLKLNYNDFDEEIAEHNFEQMIYDVNEMLRGN